MRTSLAAPRASGSPLMLPGGDGGGDEGEEEGAPDAGLMLQPLAPIYRWGGGVYC